MSNINEFKQQAYGFTQPLTSIFPFPIISKRTPTTADKAPIGQLWVIPSTNALYILSSIVNNLATWTLLEAGGGAGVFSSLVVNPGPTSLSTIGNGAVSIGNATNTGAITMTVGTGNLAIVGAGHSIGIGTDAAANIVTVGSLTNGALTTLQGGNGAGLGAAAIELATAAAGDIQIGLSTHTGAIYLGASTAGETINIGTGAASANTIAIGGTGANVITIGNTQTAGSVSVGAAMTTGTISVGGTGLQTGTISIAPGTGAQTINIAASGTGAKAINIGATGSADSIAIGSTTAGSTLVLNTPTSTPVVAANGLTATVGNLTTTNGNVVLSTAATFVQLPGPIKIMSGAGAPANGLAAEAGDMYINTTPAGATSRIYVATGAGAWTNVTCAA